MHFVYLKSAPAYRSNSGKRILNMLDFCRLYLPERAFRFPGGHRLNPEEIRDSLVPVIKRALSEDSPLCFIFDEDF